MIVLLNELKKVSFVLAELNDKTGNSFLALNDAFDLYFPLVTFYQNSPADGSQVPQAFREFYLDLLPISRATAVPLANVSLIHLLINIFIAKNGM